MITLPADWQDKIQLRGWMASVNELNLTALLVLALGNDDKQGYEYTLAVKSRPGVSKEGRDHALKNAYATLIAAVPGMVSSVTQVLDASDGYWGPIHDITNDHWEVIPMEGLEFYKRG